MNVEIEKLTTKNASALDKVAAEVFDNPINPDFLSDFLSDPRHVMFLAKDDGTVVGIASGVEYFHPDKPSQFWINEIGVATSHRNNGIGRQLLTALVDHAKANQSAYAWLGTEASNAAAQKCFGSHPEVEDPRRFLLYEWDFEDEAATDC